jgi:hypothetical protein
MALRRGIVLPAVLAVLIALALLSALALWDAVLDWRAASYADDALRARAAAMQGLAAVGQPPDLPSLCVSGPLAAQWEELPVEQGTTASVSWRSLGGGMVRVDVEGRGIHGARYRAWALLAPDTAERSMGLFRCPGATRLVPVPGHWRGRHPEG